MALPAVAIIGRPNVGKSSLLNALAGQMISIVDPTAGVTRDRISTIIEKDGKYFELFDTGGYGIVDSQQLSEHVEQQIQKAILAADLALFIVDVRDGIVPLDVKIAELLRKYKLQVIGVANKADTTKLFPSAGEFARLGFGDFLCISVKNNMNKSVLLDMIIDRIEHLDSEKPRDPAMKIALIGKQNTGKSTMVNAMAGVDRVIVSEVPGTTRDAVDVRIEKDGQIITVIDTAGVRRKTKSVQNDIEFYSFVRASRSIRRADVVLLLIDSTAPISHVDKKLANTIIEEFKSCIIVVNKWDLAMDKATTEDYEDYLTKELAGLKYAPIAFTTAKDSKNVQSVLDLAAELYKQATTQIPTAKLNKAIELMQQERQPSAKKGTGLRQKIYYATQIAVNPVTLLMFVNNPDLFDDKYKKTIVSKLRSLLPVSEVPIRLLERKHRE
ncbi:MAG: ribosome biogenesis GTPase Der [Candidatus Brocadiia bacterium]|nr:MAG: ribosome biogenesis GTPase Der [Candidatus Brocadiia bacterium]